MSWNPIHLERWQFRKRSFPYETQSAKEIQSNRTPLRFSILTCTRLMFSTCYGNIIPSFRSKRGGHWGLQYCGIGLFFMRYFGNFNLKLQYRGILKTCGIWFLAFWLVLKIVNFVNPFIFFQFPVVWKTVTIVLRFVAVVHVFYISFCVHGIVWLSRDV